MRVERSGMDVDLQPARGRSPSMLGNGSSIVQALIPVCRTVSHSQLSFSLLFRNHPRARFAVEGDVPADPRSWNLGWGILRRLVSAR